MHIVVGCPEGGPGLWYAGSMTDAGDVSVWQLIREDFRCHNRNPAATGMHALVVHRIGVRVHRSDRRWARLLRPLHRMAWMFVKGVYNVELHHGASIGRRLRLPHPHAVVLVEGAVVGDDCLIRHNVTLGAGTRDGAAPTIGNRVEFGPGSTVVGGVTVGDDVLIGPGALVIQDVPAGSRVLAPVAVIRPPRAQDGDPAAHVG